MNRIKFDRYSLAYFAIIVIVTFFLFGIDSSTIFFPGYTFAHPWEQLPGMWIFYLIWLLSMAVTACAARFFPVQACVAFIIGLIIHLVFLNLTFASVIVCCYTSFLCARYLPRRWHKPAIAGLVVGVCCDAFFRTDFSYASSDLSMHLVQIVTGLSLVGFFWLWGMRQRSHDTELQSLKDRAQLAAITERTHIAREMHDIVAHSLTGIIAQADGGRYAGKNDPDAALAALSTISQAARSSLEQMRGLLSVLRTPDDGADTRASAPSLATIPQLFQEAEANGLEVVYRSHGTPYSLDGSRELTLYRIIQEHLTNALRHAGQVRVLIEVFWEDNSVRLECHNETPFPPADPDKSSGKGLVGMKERAQIHGGRITIDRSNGFTLTAIIPRS